ncbi:InlB B-repeat-containing protein [Anaerosporobacter faecicola]|uniref:InlB B-repeat-containing protein n=1 Tax=Anaerosporobacter faecicola TaxID=2718714 RepID=UPI0014399B5C|nr:InlB B-repeat-containing protein [Anaerosporobacter faecicola]
MKKKKLLAYLLVLAMAVQIPWPVQASAKSMGVSEAEKSTTKKQVAAEEQTQNGDLSIMRGVQVSEQEAKKIPLYEPATDTYASVFAKTRNSYSSTYGYSKLSNSAQKEVYVALCTAAKEFTENHTDATAVSSGSSYYAFRLDISSYNIPTSALLPIVASLYYDHPEFYWMEAYGCTSSSTTGYAINIMLQCHEDYYRGSVRRSLDTTMDTKIQWYLDQVEGVKTDYEKELILHNTMINNISYAMDGGSPSRERWAHSIVGVFDDVHNQAVCEGYAKAFQLLMNACGINCLYIPGYGDGGGHGWNKVQLGGQWYNVDTTWDDPVDAENPEHAILRWDFFNLPDSTFGIRHVTATTSGTTINGWCYAVPSCTATTYAYRAMEASTKYAVQYTQPSNATVKLYNKGIELDSGTEVASGTAITVEATPVNQSINYTVSCKLNEESPLTMTRHTTEAGVVYYSTILNMPERSSTVYVTLENPIPIYTVSFESNGGTAVSPITEVEENSTITLPTPPTRTGYSFEGWYTDAECTDEFNTATAITSNFTLYAKWDAAELDHITAVYNGENVLVGREVNKSDILVYAHYTDGTSPMLGVSTYTINPSVITIEGNNTIEVSYNGKTTNITVVGYTQVMTHAVTFDSMGGSAVNPITNVPDRGTITLPAVPTRNGYYFAGWYTQRSCLTKFVQDTEISHDITLYAKWIALLDDPSTTISRISATYNGSNILVGNDISRSNVIVTVTDNNGSTHRVTNFTLSTTRISTVGTNTITVMYGGFSTTISVRGLSTQSSDHTPSKYVTFVTAGYHGGPVEVGSTVDRSNITVVVVYSDNTVSYVTDFAISNATINTIGNNTVYVYYDGFSASITVTGVAKGSLTPTTPVQPNVATTVLINSSSITTTTVTGGYTGTVIPRLTLTTNTNYSVINAEIEESVLASNLSGKTLSNINTYQLTITNLSSRILNQLERSSVDEVYVKICLPVQYFGRNDIRIDSVPIDYTTMTKLQNSKKKLIIQYIGSSYDTNTGKTAYTNPLSSIVIDGSTLTNAVACDVSLAVNSLDKEYKIESAVNAYLKEEDRGKGVVVTLGQTGELSNAGTVTVDVGGNLGKVKDDYVYVYGFNEKKNRLEELPKTKYKVNKAQCIVLQMEFYSKYVLLSEPTEETVTTLASRAKVSSSLTMKKNKNKQISVTLPKGITSSDVKITYSSSNKKIAYVSKTGKVYGKKKGIAVITTTVKYGNYSKKYKTTIKVK